MSDTANENLPTSLEEIRRRVLELQTLVSSQEARARRRRNSTVVSGVILTTLCVLGLGSLTGLAMQLDAHAVTQVGRLQIEKHLPTGREAFARHLQAEAPNMVRHGLIAMVGLLPKLREHAAAQILANLDISARKAEADLVAQMDEAVASTRTHLAERFPTLSESERIEAVVELVSADFREGVNAALDTLYPEFTAELDRVETFLTDLSEHEEAKLTRKERTQKELVRTLLRIMVLERSRTPES